MRSVFARLFYIITWCAIWPVFKLFTGLKVKRPKNLALTPPLVVVANHMSLLDSFLIGLSFPLFSDLQPFHFMADDAWMKSAYGRFMRAWGAFPAYYGQGLAVSLKVPKEVISRRGTVLIFPRGRCIKRFYVKKAKVGAAVLALDTGAYVLPVKISDPYPGRVLKFFLMQRRVKICVGRPFSLRDRIGRQKCYSREDYQNGTTIIARAISCLK